MSGRGRGRLRRAPVAAAAEPVSLEKQLLAARQSGKLNLDDRGLAEVPAALLTLQEASFGGKWWELGDLAQLSMRNNELRGLPAEFFEALAALRRLDLAGNRLGAVPPSIAAAAELHTLVLADNRITRLPDLSQCLGLRVLDLSGNPLNAALPPWLGALRLTELRVARCGIRALPQPVAGWRDGLKLLDASHNKIGGALALDDLDAIVDVNVQHNAIEALGGVVAAPRLRRLDVSHNRVRALDLPKGCALVELAASHNAIARLETPFFAAAVRLETLDVSACRISRLEISDEVARASPLTNLNIANNDLTEFDPRLSLLRLSKLALQGNPCRRIPQRIVAQGTVAILAHLAKQRGDGGNEGAEEAAAASMTNAVRNAVASQGISFAKQNLTAIPEALAEAPQLRALDLGRNRLTADAVARGDFAQHLPFLQELKLGSNPLGAFPAGLGSLPLRHLDLSGCRLQSLPPEVAQLPLEYLDVSRNNLVFDARTMVRLQRVRELHMAGIPSLREVPPWIADLAALEVLDLSENSGLEELPAWMATLKLGSLNAQNCSISRVAPEIGTMALSALYLEGNPLKQPRPAVLAKGTQAVLAYLRDKIVV